MKVVVTVLFVVLMCGIPAQEKVRRADDARREQIKQAKLSAIVKGQCVDGKTGEPLAGCKVVLDVWGGGSTDDLPPELCKPKPVITDADGRFALRVLAHERWQIGLDISLAGRWPRTGRWRNLLPGEVADMGAIPLHRGVHAVGRVVDEQGQPMRDAMVGIEDLGLFVGSETDANAKAQRSGVGPLGVGERSRAMHFAANSVRWCRSQADGAFTSRVALPAGTFELRIGNPNVTMVYTAKITIPAEAPMDPITVVVREPPFLGGVVVDEHGLPVKGVRVSAELKRDGRMASARTRADGTFKIYRIANCPDTVRIEVSDPGPCERTDPSKPFAWGKTGITIELQRALTVAITVVEAGTNKPVEEFAVRAFSMQAKAMNSVDRRLQLSGHHVDGKLEIPGVSRGTSRIAVIPKDPHLHCTQVDIVAEEGMESLRIEVQRLQPMMVQVLDKNGAPVANANVFVIELGNYPIHDEQSFDDPRNLDVGSLSSNPATTFDTLVHRTVTDGGGQCIAYGIGGRKDLVIGVRVGDGKLHRDTKVAFGSSGNGHTVQLDKQ